MPASWQPAGVPSGLLLVRVVKGGCLRGGERGSQTGACRAAAQHTARRSRPIAPPGKHAPAGRPGRGPPCRRGLSLISQLQDRGGKGGHARPATGLALLCWPSTGNAVIPPLPSSSPPPPLLPLSSPDLGVRVNGALDQLVAVNRHNGRLVGQRRLAIEQRLKRQVACGRAAREGRMVGCRGRVDGAISSSLCSGAGCRTQLPSQLPAARLHLRPACTLLLPCRSRKPLPLSSPRLPAVQNTLPLPPRSLAVNAPSNVAPARFRRKAPL